MVTVGCSSEEKRRGEGGGVGEGRGGNKAPSASLWFEGCGGGGGEVRKCERGSGGGESLGCCGRDIQPEVVSVWAGGKGSHKKGAK